MTAVVILNVLFSVVVIMAVVGLLLRSIASEHRAASVLAAPQTSRAAQPVAGVAPRREAPRLVLA